jgi:hypothetical protein
MYPEPRRLSPQDRDLGLAGGAVIRRGGGLHGRVYQGTQPYSFVKILKKEITVSYDTDVG